MPVKYYVGKDMQGRERGPDFSHEARPVIELIKDLYEKFNHLPELYAVIANLNKPDADLLLITEHGLGVIELKDYFGLITQDREDWYAGPKLIKAGNNARNPHEQVQNYASTIRDLLVRRGRIKEEYKVNTAVCFTNPRANFKAFKKAYGGKPMTWETFNILAPAEIPEWVVALRFGPSDTYPYQPYRLTAQQVEQLVSNTFQAIPWTEIDSLMPTGEAYAYLLLKEEGELQTHFGLKRDVEKMGRDSGQCDIEIPAKYTRASRVHAQITRSLGNVTIEDLGSSKGTFVNGNQITQATLLKEGDLITISGEEASEKVCSLEFSSKAPLPKQTDLDTSAA